MKESKLPSAIRQPCLGAVARFLVFTVYQIRVAGSPRKPVNIHLGHFRTLALSYDELDFWRNVLLETKVARMASLALYPI